MRHVLARSALTLSTVLALGLSAAGALAEPAALKLDTTHSRVGFVASTVLFDVTGKFDDFQVLLEGTPKDPEHAKVEVHIKAASIDTGIQKRDDHLRSADFFDAKKYPELVFRSDKITKRGAGLELSGKLSIHGKEKAVVIPLAVVSGTNGAGVASTAYRGKLSLKRSDFGIGADSVAAKISLDDEVRVELLIVAL